MPLQWRNQIWQSLEDGAGKRRSECGPAAVGLKPVLNWPNVCLPEHTSDTSTNYDSFLN